MGSGASKPVTEHVFYGETPIQFSNNLVESLQSSNQSDSTRSKSLELHIQSRVNSELSRLQSRESQLLSDLESRLSQQDAAAAESESESTTGGERGEGKKKKGIERERVQREIEILRKRLKEEVPRVGGIDGNVEKARGEVVRCLRENNKTPLDCYREVEEFKNQTRRLEKRFVVKTVGREF